jgi:hypothetical protein
VFRWLGLALLGIVVAAAVSIAASRLASQQIGLASQPVSAGDALAPAAERHAGQAARRHARARARHRHQGETQHPSEPAPPREEATPPASPPETEPVPPSQPPTGGGDGERGGGADD